MGLDVSFSTKEALAKGLEIRVGYNDWSELRADGYDDAQDSLCYAMKVPNTVNLLVYVDVQLESIFVRTNKWGDVYAPLTEWLKANDIPWSEF